MALTYDTSTGATVQAPPIVGELQRLFDNLEDAPLLQALVGPTRRGPKGHPAYTLWRCFLAKHYLGLESTDALIRTLTNNPWVAQACGIPWPNGIPHKSTFSRFFAKLAKRQYLHLVKDVSRRLVRRQYASIPGFGERVAIDSTTLKGWVNGGKSKPSDKDAGWSVKKNTHGKQSYTLGYKLHLLVDCETELPIAAHVSPGNANDGERASRVIHQARFTNSHFRPRYFMADAGYSRQDLFSLVRRVLTAEPIIKVNKSHKKLVERFGVWENTVTWKALFAQRTSVERAFSRLKGQRSLNHITVRRLRKVTVHCYLALITMQAVIANGVPPFDVQQ